MKNIPPLLQSKTGRFTGLVLASLLLFAWFTWPLPRHVTRGIASSHRPEIGAPRYVIPGDHLQLLYHFDLMKGFLTGRTPWFHNLYEFNVGNDADTLKIDMYYAPFSWFYTLAALGGNSALGWNFAGFASIFFSLTGTWLLVRRFPAPPAVHIAATLLGIGLPYRWITFLHGSPTGFAMVYVPWVLYGLFLAIVDRKPIGGWLAGVSMILAAWGDIHTFFFLGLLVPFWALFVFFLQEKPGWKFNELLRLALCLRGFILMGLFVVAQAVFIRLYLTDGTMTEGRTLQEVLLFARRPSGLLDRNPGNPHNEIYLTWTGLALISIAFLSGLTAWFASPARRQFKTLFQFLLLFLALIVLVILAMGPRPFGEFSRRYWEILTQLVPPYAMIRQTSKIYSILPSLLAVFLVFPFCYTSAPLIGKKWITPVFLTLSLGFILESGGRISPTISLLQKGSPAYAAVRDNAEALGMQPRALAVVLWPGDSHWTSVNQFYAMQYRIRLVNGYRPNVPAKYREDVFYPFKPLNLGFGNDELLDALLSRGVNHLILHEDAFPEQVSPFSIGATLSNLLQNPRIRILKQDREIWAFEIMREAAEEHRIQTDWSVVSSARLWHLIRFAEAESPQVVPDPEAFRGHAIRLNSETGIFTLPIDPTQYVDSLRLKLRVRGEGLLNASFRFGSEEPEVLQKAINTTGWSWIELPFPPFEGFELEIESRLSVSEGTVDLDLGTFVIGPSTMGMTPGETLTFPAPTFFRAGYTDLSQNEVVLIPNRVPHGEVFYGPRRIFPEGRYRITLRYRAESGQGEIGSLAIRDPHSAKSASLLLSGDKTEVNLEVNITEPYPLVLAFTYLRTDVVRIESLEILRIE